MCVATLIDHNRLDIHDWRLTSFQVFGVWHGISISSVCCHIEKCRVAHNQNPSCCVATSRKKIKISNQHFLDDFGLGKVRSAPYGQIVKEIYSYMVYFEGSQSFWSLFLFGKLYLSHFKSDHSLPFRILHTISLIRLKYSLQKNRHQLNIYAYRQIHTK